MLAQNTNDAASAAARPHYVPAGGAALWGPFLHRRLDEFVLEGRKREGREEVGLDGSLDSLVGIKMSAAHHARI